MVDGDGKQDRVLVRPYVKNDSDDERPGARPAPDPRASAETQVIPVAAADASSPSAEEPAPPASAGEEKERRKILWLVGSALVLILVTAAVVVAIWPRGDDQDAALPSSNGVWPAGSPIPTASAGRSGSAPVGVAVSASQATASTSASSSASASVSPSTSLSASAGSSPSATVTTSPAAPAPPASQLVGAITGGGHCLDVKGEIALLGSSLSVYSCNSTLSQKWTFATDGTLRVAGSCAAATGDNSVHVTTCGSDEDGRWAAGSGGSLVNASNGHCLTDPDAGGRTGNSLKLAVCGSSGQSWSLP